MQFEWCCCVYLGVFEHQSFFRHDAKNAMISRPRTSEGFFRNVLITYALREISKAPSMPVEPFEI